MKSKYNVIWIDDEWETMTSFKKHCMLEYQMELHPFKTHKQGLEAYARNPNFYEAAILDAKSIFDNENAVADVVHMQESILFIKANFKDLPYFISTGQPDLMNEEWFKKLYNGYYRKEIDDEKLCKDIISTIEDKPNRKIMNKYPELFSCLCPPIYEEVLDILKVHEEDMHSNADVFNKIRKVLDWLMTSLNEYGLLAIPFNGSNINECSRFLSNQKLQEVIPTYIQRHIFSLVTAANEGSHRLKIDNDVKSGAAPYLVSATIFELISVLMWYYQLPDTIEEKSKIANLATRLILEIYYEGKEFIIEKDKRNNYHCGKCRLPYELASQHLGKKVILSNVKENNAKTKDTYPFFANFKIKDE